MSLFLLTNFISAQSVISDVQCSNNGTFDTATDDFVAFKLNPQPPGGIVVHPFKYNISATYLGNPVTITDMAGVAVTQGNYGENPYYRINNGTIAAAGNIVITLTAQFGAMTQEVVNLTNPGTCSTVCTGASTGNKVTYYYENVLILDEFTPQNATLPKFDEGTSRTLTGVKIDYGFTASGSVYGENREPNPQTLRIKTEIEPYQFDINTVAHPIASKIIVQTPGYPTSIPVAGAVLVPASGAWPGDDPGVAPTFIASTLTAMGYNANTWLQSAFASGIDPTTNPLWVTQLTGNAGDDDDIAVAGNPTFAFNAPSINLTAPLDLNAYKGASTFPIAVDAYGSLTVLGGGGNFKIGNSTKARYFVKVEYTYDCAAAAVDPIDAVLDINQTPINVPVSGNVITNDEFTGTATVTSAQFYNASGVLTNLPIGTATPVFTPAGVPAGTMLLNANGTYTYTPATGFVGEIPVNYTLTNNLGSTDSTTLTIKVIPSATAGNDNPIAQNDTSFTEAGVTVSSTVLNNDSDPDGNTLTVTSATGLTIGTATVVSGVDATGNPVANAGTVQLNTNGTYTYVPAAGFVGTVNPLPYVISDGNGGTATANIYITVVGAGSTTNNTFANDDANSAPKGVTMTGNVKTNDTDPEGNTTTVTAATVFSVNGVANGTALTIGTATIIPGVGSVTLNANGTYSFVPVATYVGTVVIPYTICDNGVPQACDQATLELTSLDIVLTACYDLPNTATAGVDTKHGITILQRAGADNGNWPMIRKSAHTALESNTKGFVITRMTTAQVTAIVSPQEGMMVYDTTAKCLKLYDGTAWSCFVTPTCP